MLDLSLLKDSLAGLTPFLIYIGLSLGLIAIYCGAYMLATAHDELRLIRANNLAAAIAFAGSLIGYALPLAAAATGSRALLEFVVWGLIGIVVQIVIYWVFRLVLLPDVTRRIDAGELAAGVMLGALSLAGGIINAASMAV
jgi:putative membrane protein